MDKAVPKTKQEQTSSEKKDAASTSKQSYSPNKILINLLPLEILLERKKSTKFALVNKLSIAVLVLLVFLTSSAIALRFSQSLELDKTQKNMVFAEGKVTELRDREGQVTLLKQRLASIQVILGGDTKRKAIFNTIIYLTPVDVEITNITVDKTGFMNASLNTPSLTSFQTLIENLGDKEKNSNLIKKVELEGISVGKDGIYRFSLKIYPT